MELQRSERETTHTGERRRRETPSHPAPTAAPGPAPTAGAGELSKGAVHSGGTRGVGVSLVPRGDATAAPGACDNPQGRGVPRGDASAGHRRLSMCSQQGRGHAALLKKEPNSLFPLKINVFVIDVLFFFSFLHHQVSGDYICTSKTKLNNPAISTTAKKTWEKIKANSATAIQKRFPGHSQQKLVRAHKLWTNLHRESCLGSGQAERVPRLHGPSRSRAVWGSAGDAAARLR